MEMNRLAGFSARAIGAVAVSALLVSMLSTAASATGEGLGPEDASSSAEALEEGAAPEGSDTPGENGGSGESDEPAGGSAEEAEGEDLPVPDDSAVVEQTPDTVTLSGMLVVTPTEAGAVEVHGHGGAHEQTDAPEVEITHPGSVSLLTESDGFVELLEGEHAEYQTGQQAVATFSVPQAVQQQVDEQLEAPVQTGELVELVIEASRELGEPLEPLSHEVGAAGAAGVASAATPKAHTVDVIMLKRSTETAPAQSVFTTWLGRLSDYWQVESGGQITAVTASEAVKVQNMPTQFCGNTFGLWDWASTQFGKTSADYFDAAQPRHLIVLQTVDACNQGSYAGLGWIGDGVHTGGQTWQIVQASKPLEWDQVTFHEFGHNLSLWHSNSLTCDPGHYDTATFVASPNPGNDSTIFTPSNPHCWVEEYNDVADVMGYGWTQWWNATPNTNYSNIGALASTHRLSIDALDAASVARVDIDGGGTQTFDLKPSTDATGLRAIVVTDPQTGEEYVLEYRAGQGRDASAFYALWNSQSGGTSIELGKGVRVLRSLGDTYSAVLNRPMLPAELLQQQTPQWIAPFTTLPYLTPGSRFDGFSGEFNVEVVGMSASGAQVEISFTDGYAVPDGIRLGGASRYDTSAEVSKHAFPNTVGGTVVVALGGNYPDALSAAPLAKKLGGPLLLTAQHELPKATRDEIVRLQPSEVIIVGGSGVISASVEQQLRGLAGDVERIAGANRYETSAAIARRGWSSAQSAFIATGAGFADALSAGAAAGYLDAPAILVPGGANTAPASVQMLLIDLEAQHLFIAGGKGVVSTGMEQSLRGALSGDQQVTRFAGTNRYDTSARIGAAFHTPGGRVYLASGASFPDALAGAAAAGANGAPLLLASAGCIPQPVRSVQLQVKPGAVYLLGGAGALSEAVRTGRMC